MYPSTLFLSKLHLFLLFLLLCLVTLTSAIPTNSTIVPRKDVDPGDTLGRTMCFCTNDQNFTQATYDPYADYVEHPGHMKDHKIAFVYKFEYYNHRLDHHFALHALDICTTRGYDPNPCLNWPAQHADWCHTFHTPQVPDGVKYHQWEFCYQFRGDTFHNPDHLDAWTFYKDKREVPRKRTWMGDEALVRERCGEVCRDKWGMDVFEDRLGTELARVDYFDKFDDICYHGSAANDMGCDWNQGGG